MLVADGGGSRSALGNAVFLAERAMETRREFRTNKIAFPARAWYYAFALNTSVVLCGPSSRVVDLRLPACSLLRTFSA